MPLHLIQPVFTLSFLLKNLYQVLVVFLFSFVFNAYAQPLGDGYGQADLPESYVKTVITGAKTGNTELQFELSKLYAEGKGGLEKDEKLAFFWRFHSAQSGYTPAQVALAENYWKGDYVEQDWQRYILWLERAAKANNMNALMRLGEIFSKGIYPEKVNRKRALAYYKKAGDLGNYLAKFQQALIYEKEPFNHPDRITAVNLMLELTNEKGMENQGSLVFETLASSNHLRKETLLARKACLEERKDKDATIALNMVMRCMTDDMVMRRFVDTGGHTAKNLGNKTDVNGTLIHGLGFDEEVAIQFFEGASAVEFWFQPNGMFHTIEVLVDRNEYVSQNSLAQRLNIAYNSDSSLAINQIRGKLTHSFGEANFSQSVRSVTVYRWNLIDNLTLEASDRRSNNLLSIRFYMG